MSNGDRKQGLDRGKDAERVAQAEADAAADDQAHDFRMRVMARRWIQRKASRGAGATGELPKAAAPLPNDVRAKMEPQLGADLSSVKVGTDGKSAVAAERIGARAFTVDGEVHFGAGEFAPGTKEGDRLLAHELTHVVQGQRSGVQRKADHDQDENAAEHDVSQPGDPAEQEADAVADDVTDKLHDHRNEAHGSGAHAPEAGAAAAGGQKARPISAKLYGVGTKIYRKAPPTDASKAGKDDKAGKNDKKAGADAGHGQWEEAKAQLAAGKIPPPKMLPPTKGNTDGLSRLHDIETDKNLPPDVRGKFMAAFAAKIGSMKDPPESLFEVLKQIVHSDPDSFLRKGTKLPSADYVKNTLGGLKRAISLKAACAGMVTAAFYERARKADKTLPPNVADINWGNAQRLVELIKSSKVAFNPNSDLNGGAMIAGRTPGSSGWYFAGKDASAEAPKELQVQLAVGAEYADGYIMVELPPELAAPAADQGGGHGAGAQGGSRPTALDLCLAPEGKLNPDEAAPVGHTAPTAPGQVGLREVVMPPLPLSAMASRRFAASK
ncbi:MAG: hypothetical protein JWN44_2117 [Myxococcales bacterium]|nr:hypothetical protein [Myxococcales bacterium]